MKKRKKHFIRSKKACITKMRNRLISVEHTYRARMHEETAWNKKHEYNK